MPAMDFVLTGVVVYVVGQLALGLWVSRHIRTEEDYLLAGRSLGHGLATFSFFATWFGAETCIGAAGAIYERGLAGGAEDPFGYGLCILLMGFVFAAALWRRGLTTVADLFRDRYSPGVEKIVVLITVPTSLLWAAAQIRAFGQVLGAASGLDVTTSIALATGVVVAYTFTGGLRADVVTDLVQGIAIIVGLGVLVMVLPREFAALPSLLVGASPAGDGIVDGPGGNAWRVDATGWLETIEAWAIPICGSLTAQELVARVLACRSPGVARRSAVLGGGLYVAVGLIPVGIGLIGARLVPDLAEAEQLLPRVAADYLPPFLYVIFLGALISAILSTVDSALLAAAALTCHNLIMPMVPALTEQRKVRLHRIGVVLGGLAAAAMALASDSIYELVVESSAFGGAGIFVVFVVALFSRRGGPASAYAALAAGALVYFAGRVLWPFGWVFVASLLAAVGAYGAGVLIEGEPGGAGSPAAGRPSLPTI